MSVALPRRVAAVGHRHGAVGHLPATESLLQGLPHGVLDRLEEREGHRAELDLQPELDTCVDRSGLESQADRSEERVRLLAHELDGSTGADRPLDADHRRLVEVDIDAEVVCERRLDHLLLHLAVERDGDLLPQLVLAQVDQG